jgi:hypothetical protein
VPTYTSAYPLTLPHPPPLSANSTTSRYQLWLFCPVLFWESGLQFPFPNAFRQLRDGSTSTSPPLIFATDSSSTTTASPFGHHQP